MMNHDEPLPGLGAIKRNIGPNEAAARDTLHAMREAGHLRAEHAALEQLVLSTARDIDDIKPDDAASGRATLRKTYLAVLQQLATLAPVGTSVDTAPDVAVVRMLGA